MNELKTKGSASLSDSVKHNERAWDHYVEQGVSWTQAVDADAIARAKEGNFEVHLGLKRPIERKWFPSDMNGLKVLCLAGGGGQQGPLLAAMGAAVTVMDLSAGQLAADIKSAELNGLSIQTEQGDMRDLSRFSSELFDIILCPVSITYIPELKTLYQECFRVLKPEGCFMLAAPHPSIYLFDADLWDQGIFQVTNRLPFNSMDELDEDEQRQFIADKKAIEFSHTMEQIIGGQLDAGFVIDRFVEDKLDEGLSHYMSDYFATRARKLVIS
ncbi:class I SAM-dependent methyltransferase [Vibrio sp. WXL210]|uniref:class I SAM-dependent methyltransferase n=1 Tax=Vibrio sp. WXL210 TaxID=3450709 RepID=UPI003EC8EF2C